MSFAIVRFESIGSTLRSFDSLYREIAEYNTAYWSKFLFSLWLLFSSLIILGIYMFFFIDLELIVRSVHFYAIILYFLLYNSILTNACSINSEANKSLRLFHLLAVEYSRYKKRVARLTRVKILFKVKIQPRTYYS